MTNLLGLLVSVVGSRYRYTLYDLLSGFHFFINRNLKKPVIDCRETLSHAETPGALFGSPFPRRLCLDYEYGRS
jgi:hypothetical protein